MWAVSFFNAFARFLGTLPSRGPHDLGEFSGRLAKTIKKLKRVL